MKTSVNPFPALHARRLIVALAITGAATVVGSAIVLSERSVRSDVLALSAAAELLLGGGEAVEDCRWTAARSPKGGSRRLVPPPPTGKSLSAYTPADASLPSASDVFGASPSAADEAAPTF